MVYGRNTICPWCVAVPKCGRRAGRWLELVREMRGKGHRSRILWPWHGNRGEHRVQGVQQALVGEILRGYQEQPARFPHDAQQVVGKQLGIGVRSSSARLT